MGALLKIDYALNEAQLKVLIPVVTGLIAYFIYWLVHESVGLKRRLESRYGEEKASKQIVLFTKLLGGLLLGLFPFLVFRGSFPDTTLSQLGFGFNRSTMLNSLVFVVGIGGLMALILYFLSKNASVQSKHPEIKVREWKRNLVVLNLLAWAVYLLGYEFFFRGVLLFPLTETIGLWPAIAVNVVFYAGVHLPRGVDEALLAVPFGIILCLITVATGTIWFAFLVHLANASTVTLAAIKHNPDIRILKGSRK